MTSPDDTPRRRQIVRQIGDVTVTIDVPAECPDPDVNLWVHTGRTTEEQRAHAMEAFGLTDKDVKNGGHSVWADTGDQPLRAIVALAPNDNIARPDVRRDRFNLPTRQAA